MPLYSFQELWFTWQTLLRIWSIRTVPPQLILPPKLQSPGLGVALLSIEAARRRLPDLTWALRGFHHSTVKGGAISSPTGLALLTSPGFSTRPCSSAVPPPIGSGYRPSASPSCHPCGGEVVPCPRDSGPSDGPEGLERGRGGGGGRGWREPLRTIAESATISVL